MKTTPNPPRGYKKRAQTKRKLLDAGARCFTSKGMGMTIRDIVKEAGVSNGTFYNYFDDTDQLIEELLQDTLLQLLNELNLTPRPDPVEQFTANTVRVLTLACQKPDLFRLIVRLVTRVELNDAIRGAIQATLHRSVEAGRFSLPPDDTTLDLIMGTMLMSTVRITTKSVPDGFPEKVTERLLLALGVEATEAAALIERVRSEDSAPS